MADKSHTILCVDDEPLNLKLLEALLTPRGYHVIEARNGEEALLAVEKHEVDIILLDVMMPEMDGFTVCRKLKNDESFRNIPVIMLTALSSKEDRIRGIDSGAEDFISKPFDRGEVLARIKMLLKMKDLNQKLFSAYNNIRSLTSFGKSVISSFDPLEFNLPRSIDRIVEQLVRKDMTTSSRPALVIYGEHTSEKQCIMYRYCYIDGELRREIININRNACCRMFGRSDGGRISILNNDDITNGKLSDYIKNLKSHGIEPSNIVAYTGSDICLFALDYPDEVTNYEAAVLENLVTQALFLRSLSAQVTETEDAFDILSLLLPELQRQMMKIQATISSGWGNTVA